MFNEATGAGVDWWSVSATLFAAASLIAVVWQILRFEATQATLGWEVGYSRHPVVTNGRCKASISFRPVGPIILHEVEAHAWEAARVPQVSERARMDCDSEPLSAEVEWIDGAEAYAGFAWIRPGVLRPKAVRQAMRVRLGDGQWFIWRWYVIPRPDKRRQGRWAKWEPRQARRTFIPGMWGLPGDR